MLNIRKATRKKWCAAVMLDVKNAFNSACWGTQIKKLKRRNFPQHLLNVLGSYFEKRWITLGGESIEV